METLQLVQYWRSEVQKINTLNLRDRIHRQSALFINKILLICVIGNHVDNKSYNGRFYKVTSFGRFILPG